MPMASNSPTICAFPDSFKNPTIRNIPAAEICKTHSTTFTIFPVELEPDRVLSASACAISLPLLPSLIIQELIAPILPHRDPSSFCSSAPARLKTDLLQQPDERLALRPGQGGGRESFQVCGVIGVGACDQLPAFLRQMN